MDERLKYKQLLSAYIGQQLQYKMVGTAYSLQHTQGPLYFNPLRVYRYKPSFINYAKIYVNN